MIFINCTENCVHQKDGMCTLEQVGKISNTTSTGCEFYVEKNRKPAFPDIIQKSDKQ